MFSHGASMSPYINKPGNIMFLCILFFAHFKRSGSNIGLYMCTYKNAEKYDIIMNNRLVVTCRIRLHPVQEYSACLMLASHSARAKNKSVTKC